MLLAGGVPVYVDLKPPTWGLDVAALAAAFGSRTKAIVLNSPGNPTGALLSDGDVAAVAALCAKHDVIAISDKTKAPTSESNRRARADKA